MQEKHSKNRIERRCVNTESEVDMPGMMKMKKVMPKRKPRRAAAKKKKPAMRRGGRMGRMSY